MSSGEEPPAFPDEITLDGYPWRLVAHKRGLDKNGTMRYRMEYANGEPVVVAKAEYRHNEVGVVFASRFGGKIAFDFKLGE